MAAKLIFCNVPSDNPQNALQFYGTLLGIAPNDFAQAPTEKIESYQHLISPDGIDLKVASRNNPNERITCYFAVDDLDGMLKQLQSIGGNVIVQPAPAEIAQAAVQEIDVIRKSTGGSSAGQQANPEVGRWALVRDPDGNLVGLTQLTSSEARMHYKVDTHRPPFSKEDRDAEKLVKQLRQKVKKP